MDWTASRLMSVGEGRSRRADMQLSSNETSSEYLGWSQLWGEETFSLWMQSGSGWCQWKVSDVLLVPISSSDATDRDEKKDTCTPDVHGVSLCPGTQKRCERIIILKVSGKRSNQPKYCGKGLIDGHGKEFVGLLYGENTSLNGVERRYYGWRKFVCGFWGAGATHRRLVVCWPFWVGGQVA